MKNEFAEKYIRVFLFTHLYQLFNVSSSQCFVMNQSDKNIDNAPKNEDASKPQNKTFEDLFQLVGGIGIAQILVLFIVGYEALPNGMGTYLVIFTQAIPDHRCKISTLDDSYRAGS